MSDEVVVYVEEPAPTRPEDGLDRLARWVAEALSNVEEEMLIRAPLSVQMASQLLAVEATLTEVQRLVAYERGLPDPALDPLRGGEGQR
jgi:hypothetical protein